MHRGTRILLLAIVFGALVTAQLPAQRPRPISYAAFLTWVNGGDGVPPAHDTTELLSRMPAEFRASFTLVYNTRSPHHASVDPLHPRVILFSPNGELLLAMTGDPEKPAFDIVEAIHFDRKAAAFNTSKFVLPAAVERDPRLNDATQTNGELNRSECTACHGRDPRPIFDGYGLWPGFYGSRADTLSLNPEEKRNYLRFMNAVKAEPRSPYRWLGWPQSRATGPYLDRPALPGQTPPLEFLPNTRLGIALTRLNRQRIFRSIRSAAGYGNVKHELAAGLIGCAPMPLPKGLEKQVDRWLQQENTARLTRGSVDSKAANSSQFFLQELHPPVRRNLAELVYIADRLGVDRNQWSMAFESGSLAFYDGILNGDDSLYVKADIAIEMLRDIARDNAEIARLLFTYNLSLSGGEVFDSRLDRQGGSKNRTLCELLSQKRVK